MNRSRQGPSHARGLVCRALVFALGGCVSNPTPHPANDATQETRVDDVGVTAPTDQASCEDLGGFWSGEGCYDSDAPDAALLDVHSPETPDGADGADGADGVDGAEIGDGYPDGEGEVGPNDTAP